MEAKDYHLEKPIVYRWEGIDFEVQLVKFDREYFRTAPTKERKTEKQKRLMESERMIRTLP